MSRQTLEADPRYITAARAAHRSRDTNTLKDLFAEHGVDWVQLDFSAPIISTMDINQHTREDAPPPPANKDHNLRVYSCEKCAHVFSVYWGKEEEECPGCYTLLPWETP